jgi:hypothetical protein
VYLHGALVKEEVLEQKDLTRRRGGRGRRRVVVRNRIAFFLILFFTRKTKHEDERAIM